MLSTGLNAAGLDERQMEALASEARFHAKLATLRDALLPVTSTHDKEMLEKIADDINAAFDKIYLHKPEGSTEPTRGQMIEYVQQAIKEGYDSYYNLPEHGIAWLSNECLKVDYGAAWEYYNLSADENGKAPQRDLGE